MRRQVQRSRSNASDVWPTRKCIPDSMGMTKGELKNPSMPTAWSIAMADSLPLEYCVQGFCRDSASRPSSGQTKQMRTPYLRNIAAFAGKSVYTASQIALKRPVLPEVTSLPLPAQFRVYTQRRASRWLCHAHRAAVSYPLSCELRVLFCGRRAVVPTGHRHWFAVRQRAFSLGKHHSPFDYRTRILHLLHNGRAKKSASIGIKTPSPSKRGRKRPLLYVSNVQSAARHGKRCGMVQRVLLDVRRPISPYRPIRNARPCSTCVFHSSADAPGRRSSARASSSCNLSHSASLSSGMLSAHFAIGNMRTKVSFPHHNCSSPRVSEYSSDAVLPQDFVPCSQDASTNSAGVMCRPGLCH